MQIIKEKARERGIEKDKEKVKALIRELKLKAEHDRCSLKKPPLEPQEVVLKFGHTELSDDAKVLLEYGRIKDGSVLTLVRKMTAHASNKLVAIQSEQPKSKEPNIEEDGKKRREILQAQME